MRLKAVFGILLLTTLIMCDDDFIIMKLADGGTSSPIKLMAEESEDAYENTILETDVENIYEKNKIINSHDKRELETESILPESDTIHPDLQNSNLLSEFSTISPQTNTETNTILTDQVIPTVFTTNIPPTTLPEETTESTSIMASTISTTISPTTLSVEPTTPKTTSVVQSTIPNSSESSVVTPTTETKICHESCRSDVGAIYLYQLQTTLTLPVGSNLTLVCELPLTANFTLENLLWLYEAERTPECSLTSEEFITSCRGFQVIHNEDDRNETFIKKTLDITGLSHNNTGTFICQAEVTCCRDTSDENVIIRQEYLNVKIWHSDYSLDFAIMGSVAAVMILAVATISFLISRRRRIAYVPIDDRIIEVKPTNVLHMPLVQYDDDNDSFDSNFD
ncbi:unnamed protein product [Meganyctiphanes norvegica]|uniref:Ig-like domain-containing protein n=1 Tax=Meganyctiphanes norvegica TaxID=48144 RepID=A0AAV2RSD2_MEGNR